MSLANLFTRHLVLAWLAVEPGLAAEKLAQPFEWQAATPESQGMSKGKLDALTVDLAKRNTRAFLVVRHDKLVHEWYAPGVTATTKQGTASLAKAVVGGVSLALLLTDKKLSLD